jgi:hypothetical protein
MTQGKSIHHPAPTPIMAESQMRQGKISSPGDELSRGNLCGKPPCQVLASWVAYSSSVSGQRSSEKERVSAVGAFRSSERGRERCNFRI